MGTLMKKIITSILLVSLIFITNIFSASAFTPLDQILEYHIYVNPTVEGNLDMEYHIKWKVLDDDSEGPLEWVKIGVPNRYVSNVKILSDSIKSAEYYSDGGAYIRLDLKKKYYEDQIVNINFSFTQTHIYTLNDDYVEYSFIPGWFDEIKINELKVFWKNTNVDYCNTNKTTGEYYLWEAANLNYGESIKVNLRYKNTAFINLSEDNQYVDKYMTKSDYITIIIILSVILAITLTIIIVAYHQNDGYYSYRGFTGTRIRHRYYWWHHHHGVDSKGKETKPPVIRSTGGGHSGGSSCACACACACAGGGRAGCSRKDFYNPNIKIDELIKKLEE